MKIFLFFCIAVFLSFRCAAQAQEPQTCPQSCGISEVLNRNGWKIPGLSRGLSGRHAQWTTGGLENVFVDFLEPISAQASVVLVSTSRGRVGTVEVREQPVEVTEILRFTMNGHIFAYRVTAVPVSVDKHGKRTPLGSEERLGFYDVDGSGRFTVMRDAGTLEPFVPVIPDWVRKLPN